MWIWNFGGLIIKRIVNKEYWFGDNYKVMCIRNIGGIILARKREYELLVE